MPQSLLSSSTHFAYVVPIVSILWLCLPRLCHSSVACSKNNLDYVNTVYFEDTQTFSLRICCHITRLWFAQLNDDWRLSPAPGLQWRSVSNLTLPGFNIPVSKCPNDTFVLGQVTNKHCSLLEGNMITLTKSLEQLPEFDQWYVTCYERRLPDAPTCRICKLEMYCTHPRRCNEIFIHRDIVNASSTTMTVVVSVGNLPFEADIWTEVTVTSRLDDNNNNNINNNKNSANNKNNRASHYQDTARAPRNRSLRYEIDGLRPNTWYQIMTCAVVRTPLSFRLQYPDVYLPDEQRFCLELEGYRTWMLRNRSSSAVRLKCFFCYCHFLLYKPIVLAILTLFQFPVY